MGMYTTYVEAYAAESKAVANTKIANIGGDVSRILTLKTTAVTRPVEGKPLQGTRHNRYNRQALRSVGYDGRDAECILRLDKSLNVGRHVDRVARLQVQTHHAASYD